MLAPVEKTAVPLDPLALRKAFGTFVTGVTVVTTCDADGTPRGMTANSFTSVSLDPPLLLVCIGKSASSFPVFDASESFAVNILHEGQAGVSGLFASKSADKFGHVDHDVVHTGAPVLTECLSWFDCSVHQRVDAGDHLLLIGQVQAFGTTPAAPLGFCRGRYADVKDPLPSGWPGPLGMIVGYLVEAEGQILLRATGSGWSLPTAPRRIADDALPLESGEALSLVADETFLYSVFDVAESDPGYLIYRARLSETAARAALPPGFRFFPIDQLPYDEIPTREIRGMLGRYVREHASGHFGIYVDFRDRGRLAMVGAAQAWSTNP